jgi:hypothetical protein
MKRKAVHLVAAILESLRFLAVMFLAFSVGAISENSVAKLLRYAAAPQLLFAAGFFFVWLDAKRYAAYKSLLIVGKAACLACLPAAAIAIGRDPAALSGGFGIPLLSYELVLFIGLVDVASLCILLAMKTRPEIEADEEAEKRGLATVQAQGAPAEAKAESGTLPGQGPDDIERVEV